MNGFYYTLINDIAHNTILVVCALIKLVDSMRVSEWN
jgi:hypothetical protein